MAGKYQSKEQIASALKGLGSGSSELEFPSVNESIAQTFDDLIKQLRKNLSIVKNGQKSTDDQNESNLGTSIDPLPIKIMGSKIFIELKFNDYGFDLDKGTRPHAPPVKAMVSWIASRPSLQRIAIGIDNKKKIKNLAQTKLSLAFAIQQNIKKKGTVKRYGYRGTGWFSNAVGDGKKFEEQLAKKVSIALGKDVELKLKIMANEINK